MTGQLAFGDEPNITTTREEDGEGAGLATVPAPSPERFKPTRRRLRSGRIVFLHPCRQCGGMACHGYGCDLLAVPPKPGDWYCRRCMP